MKIRLNLFNIYPIWILYIVLPSLLIGQSHIISGIVTDETGNPLPYVSIFENNTSNATLSNMEGFYELEVNLPTTVLFQYLGYETVSLQLAASNAKSTQNVKMLPAIYELGEIEVIAEGEDPAYGIMREVIARKKSHRHNKQRYSANLYVKGNVKLKDVPDKILGTEVGDLDGILDSSRQGIIYLSETESIYKKDGSNHQEVLLSSRLAGDDKGIGFNQFLSPHLDFYEENITFSRNLISPLNDDAFIYYQFRLESRSIDHRGKMIHQISVTPKDENRPCFSGTMYIDAESYHIQSLALAVTGSALKSPVFQKITIAQTHTPVQNTAWRLITQTISFNINYFGLKAVGDFNSVFSKYELDPNFDGGKFKSIQLMADEAAIRNDTAFWNARRPIPLTDEEKRDYIKKDSLKNIWESKAYLDSIDRKNNRIGFGALITGYSFQNSFKKRQFQIASPLFNANFNPVEGLNASLNTSFSTALAGRPRALLIENRIRYGFLDKKWKPFLAFRWRINPMNKTSLRLGIGRTIDDLSDPSVLSELMNSWFSLFYKDNFIKYYQNDHAYLRFSREIARGLDMFVRLHYGQRTSLRNTTNFSFRRKSEIYEPNIPQEKDFEDWVLSSKKAALTASFIFNPGQKVMIYPDHKVRINSGWPTLNLRAEFAFPLANDFDHFFKIEGGLKDEYLKTGNIGHLSYQLNSGVFILNNRTSFPDYFHFIGQELLYKPIDKYSSTYRLLFNYDSDNTNGYLSSFVQYHFDGWIMDKIPLARDWGWKWVLSNNTLIQNDNFYVEQGIGIEGIRIGKLNFLRVDYFWGFNQEGLTGRNIRIGYVNFINDGVRI